MKVRILCLILIPFLFGCDNNINNFVSEVTPPDLVAVAPSSPDSSKAIKISPGHVETSGTHLRASLTVTPTLQSIAGSHYRAELTINQQRR